MVDETPYIYVDNRRIAPIQRLPRSTARPAPAARQEEQPFGVVDRVTISPQGLERSRQHHLEAAKARPEATPMLTYSPRQLAGK